MSPPPACVHPRAVVKTHLVRLCAPVFLWLRRISAPGVSSCRLATLLHASGVRGMWASWYSDNIQTLEPARRVGTVSSESPNQPPRKSATRLNICCCNSIPEAAGKRGIQSRGGWWVVGTKRAQKIQQSNRGGVPVSPQREVVCTSVAYWNSYTHTSRFAPSMILQLCSIYCFLIFRGILDFPVAVRII